MKKTTIAIVVIIIIIVGYIIIRNLSNNNPQNLDTTLDTTEQVDNQTATTTKEQTDKSRTVIGMSVEGRDITAYHYGIGDTEILFVGGIHGGYEWNTVLTAYGLMDYLTTKPSAVPQNVKVTVIPVLNPDGLNKTMGTTGLFTKADVPTTQSQVIAGRFNANKVDLNRNFDCDWQATGKWQNTDVSGGSSAFSEPESLGIKNYIETNQPKAVVVWYSAANGVFASSCHNGVLPETQTITKVYSNASGYPAYQEFNFYEITGDMVNWLAKNNIPAISVLLSTHDDAEWSKNQKGIDALLAHYAK
ncbi:MAG: hypothetical protein HQ402_02070 [Parcubacteria group bacterium]|nr:hypothetical protein [Parcubacteria group bacterium]